MLSGFAKGKWRGRASLDARMLNWTTDSRRADCRKCSLPGNDSIRLPYLREMLLNVRTLCGFQGPGLPPTRRERSRMTRRGIISTKALCCTSQMEVNEKANTVSTVITATDGGVDNTWLARSSNTGMTSRANTWARQPGSGRRRAKKQALTQKTKSSFRDITFPRIVVLHCFVASVYCFWGVGSPQLEACSIGGSQRPRLSSLACLGFHSLKHLVSLRGVASEQLLRTASPALPAPWPTKMPPWRARAEERRRERLHPRQCPYQWHGQRR